MQNTTSKITVGQLRQQTPAGYNLAAIVHPDYDIHNLDIFASHDATSRVLSEAEGPLGVLRSLDMPGRKQGIQGALARTGETVKILHLQFLPDGATLSVYTVIVHKDKTN